MTVRRSVRTMFAAALVAAAATLPAHADTFIEWRDGFAAELRADGVDPSIVAAMLDGLEPDPRVIDRDRNQPERVRPLWEYVEFAASDQRTEAGRSAQAQHAATLQSIAETYSVDPGVVTAIWGLESAYGRIQGDFDIVRSLATLAWDGRRRGFAEAQLRAVARMIERGYADRDELKGSWAGAMGHTQFIPSTYLERAVDFDADGRRDIWTDVGDALASAANLLKNAGWREGAPVAVAVTLPEGFDFAGWDERRRRPVAEWAMEGVAPVGDAAFTTDALNGRARLILPAGAGGPGFLVFENFEALLAYNNSSAYALGVAYLAEAFQDGARLPGGWPENDPPVSRSEAEALQRGLRELGFDPGGVDGVVGPNTRRALRAFQRENGLTPDGYAGRQAYLRVVEAAGAGG